MPQIQVDALMTLVRQLPELVEQLKIANKLKAWELKEKHCSSVQALYDGYDDTDEIEEIMKGS